MRIFHSVCIGIIDYWLRRYYVIYIPHSINAHIGHKKAIKVEIHISNHVTSLNRQHLDAILNLRLVQDMILCLKT